MRHDQRSRGNPGGQNVLAIGKNLPLQGGMLESVKCSEKPGERRAEDGPLDSARGGHRCSWREQFQWYRDECLVGIQGQWGTHVRL